MFYFDSRNIDVNSLDIYAIKILFAAEANDPMWNYV